MQTTRVAILGGGISGLSLGYYLQRYHPNSLVTLVEKSHSLGGWMQSTTKDDFFFDKGPRTFRTKSAKDLLELVRDLKIENSLIGSNPQAGRRFILAEGKLREVSLNPFCYVMRKCLPEILREWKKPPQNGEDESVWSFSMRRFGPRVTELLLDPLVTGVYAGDIKKVSVRSAFPFLKELEEKYGSATLGVIKRMFEPRTLEKGPAFRYPLFSFKEGAAELVRELVESTSMRVILDNKVEDLQFSEEGVNVITPFESISVDHVFSTLPPQEIGRLLRPYHEQISRLLLSIPMASLIVVNLGFKKQVLRHHGFGYLVPSIEKEDILGVVFDSEIFPDQNIDEEETRLTVMLKFSEETNEQILSKCMAALERQLEITASPDTYEITRAVNCIPQYEIGHEEKIQKIKKLLSQNFPKLSLGGNFEKGVSVNACIRQSKMLASEFSCDK